MPDSKSLPTGSPKDSDDHSDKVAGRTPEQSASDDDTTSSPNREIDTTVVLGDDTTNASSDQTVSLDGSGKAGQEARSGKTMVLGDDDSPSKPSNEPPSRGSQDPMQTMVIGEGENLRDLFSEAPEQEENEQGRKPDHGKTVSLDPNPPASRADDPMQTMIIGEGESLRDLIEKPEPEKKKEQRKPDHQKTVSLDPNPPASRADDPMQTMIIGEGENLRDLIEKPEPEEKKEERKPDHQKTVSLDPNPPASRAGDPIQTMIIGEGENLRDLISDKPEAKDTKEQQQTERPKTVSLDPNPPASRGAGDPNQTMVIGDDTSFHDLLTGGKKSDPPKTPADPGHQKTVSLDGNAPPSRGSSSKSSTSGHSQTAQDATRTSVLGQGGAAGTSPGDVGQRTMPLNSGNTPPPSDSSRPDTSGTMVLGGNKDTPPPPSNVPQDPRSKTVVLGNQAEAPQGGEPGNRTMPLDGSAGPPPRSGVQTAVLGSNAPNANVPPQTKTVVLGEGQSARSQNPGNRTVPLNELAQPPGHDPLATERSMTEPLVPAHESAPTFGNEPLDDTGQDGVPGSTPLPPLRASSLSDRAGETKQAQLLRRTTSALAFTALAIVISILCATLSSSAVSITYWLSVLSLFVGMFSFWRYTRLLKLLGTALGH